eukprot:TRINITY_DN1900_c0_g1_i2.p1 TRINITY_DN1900_c0_g1~~TRINITY_DN1900_c0_g1_i2.p1  ORF type:complete len:309 (+),score=64.11 TRINITY_DN1900_c0_g1_i2:56-982(+)
MSWFNKMFSKKESEPEQEVINPEPKKPNRSIAAVLKSILGSVKLGSDVMSQGISLPSWMYEPLSILQRQSEVLEYHTLLDMCAAAEDQYERMALLTAFAISGYSSTERFLNNFNPILGETFEIVRDDFRYLTEQVSHHPPISAVIAENDNWVWYQNCKAHTGFLGNVVEIDTHARNHFEIKGTGEHFFYTAPSARLHNIIIGSMWLQHCGDLVIQNSNTGDVASVHFRKAGMLHGGPYYAVKGTIKDAEGEDIVEIEANWNEYVRATFIDPNQKFSNGENTIELWRVSEDNNLGGLYNFTPFAASLAG